MCVPVECSKLCIHLLEANLTISPALKCCYKVQSSALVSYKFCIRITDWLFTL